MTFHLASDVRQVLEWALEPEAATGNMEPEAATEPQAA